MVSATPPGWCLVFPKPDHREAIELLNLLTIARSAAMWIATEIAADLPQTW
jgi:diadenosine tetraphosphate (Ap4A) HIT family hydrolase